MTNKYSMDKLLNEQCEKWLKSVSIKAKAQTAKNSMKRQDLKGGRET